MNEITRVAEPGAGAAAQGDRRRLPFGFVAFVGAATSLVFCYVQVLISLMAPLFGLAAFEMNLHLQAVFMWAFALVTVSGLARDRRHHHSNLPLILSGAAVLIIAGTLYTYYDIRILILGYVLLVISALLNQNRILVSLNKEVRTQARQLGELNSTLEKRVESQVAEIGRLARLKRFLAPEVADLITSEGNESLLDHHRRYIACLFCDIRDFTPLTEELEPEEVMNVLQTFHESLGRLIAKRGGTIGYRAGDGLMVFFNDPLPCDAPVFEAASLALEMKSTFIDARREWERLGHKLGLGMGIAGGYATLGFVGYEGRFDYTAIGNVVNIASRLCDNAGDGEILINQRAYLDIEGEVQAERRGPLDLKGVGKQVESYHVVKLSEGGDLLEPTSTD